MAAKAPDILPASEAAFPGRRRPLWAYPLEARYDGSGNPDPKHTELIALVARRKLNLARLVSRQIALGDVTETLERMRRFETVGFEVITRFTWMRW